MSSAQYLFKVQELQDVGVWRPKLTQDHRPKALERLNGVSSEVDFQVMTNVVYQLSIAPAT